MKLFVFSDLHFQSDKEFIYGRRGYSSMDEHDQAIVDNWNSVVGEDDVVYLLGDAIMGGNDGLPKAIEYFKQLNGHIRYVLGNHCSDRKLDAMWECENFEKNEGWGAAVQYGKWRFILTHYPTLTNNDDAGKPLKQLIWNISGHTHSSNKQNAPMSYNVCPEANNNTPVLLDDIIIRIKEKFAHDESR